MLANVLTLLALGSASVQAAPASLGARATTVSTCLDTCLTGAASNTTCGTDYTSNECGCSSDFRSAAKSCTYGACSDEVQTLYSLFTEYCDGGEIVAATAAGASATTTAALSSATDANGYTTCQKTCAESAFTNTTCGSSYLSTDCLCDSSYYSAVKVCLYQTEDGACSSDVTSWYNILNKVTCPSASSLASQATASAAATIPAASGDSASSSAVAASTTAPSSGAISLKAGTFGLLSMAFGSALLL